MQTFWGRKKTTTVRLKGCQASQSTSFYRFIGNSSPTEMSLASSLFRLWELGIRLPLNLIQFKPFCSPFRTIFLDLRFYCLKLYNDHSVKKYPIFIFYIHILETWSFRGSGRFNVAPDFAYIFFPQVILRSASGSSDF